MSIAFRVCVRFKHFGQRSRGYLHGCRSFWGRFHRRSTSLQVQRYKLSLGRPQRLALPTRFQWHVTITQWPFAHSLFVKRIFLPINHFFLCLSTLVDPVIVGQQGVFLVLHGVDTVADVFLNGIYLATTDNMFVRYKFNVRYLLKVNIEEGRRKNNEFIVCVVLSVTQSADLAL